MRLIKGTLDNGQLLLDEPVDSTKPVRVMVTFLDETNLPKGRPNVNELPVRWAREDDSERVVGRPPLQFNPQIRGMAPEETFRREDMYGDDGR